MRRLAVALALGFAMVCPVESGDFASPGRHAIPLRSADAVRSHARHAEDPLGWVLMLGAFGLLGAMLRVRPQTGAK